MQRREIDEPVAGEHLKDTAPFQIGEFVGRLDRRLSADCGCERRGGVAPPSRGLPARSMSLPALSIHHVVAVRRVGWWVWVRRWPSLRGVGAGPG